MRIFYYSVPNKEPVLLFSPHTGTNSEENMKIGRSFFLKLKQQLGTGWNDEWYEKGGKRGINVVERINLPRILQLTESKYCSGTSSENNINWTALANNSLEAAQLNLEKGFYDGAIFHSQQAAESAIKGLHRIPTGIQAISSIGLYPNYIYGLLSALPKDINLTQGIMEVAKRLDECQINPMIAISSTPLLGGQYANSLFGVKEASRCVEYARQLVDFCKKTNLMKSQ